MFGKKKKNNPEAPTPEAPEAAAPAVRKGAGMSLAGGKAAAAGKMLFAAFSRAFPIGKLFAPFRRLRPQKILGLQLESSSASLVLLRKGALRVKTLRAEVIDLAEAAPEGAGNGVMSQEETAVALAAALKQRRIKYHRLSLGLPKDDSILLKFEFPPVTEKNLARMIQFEVNRRVPLKPSEVTFDYERLQAKAKANGKVKVLVAASATKALEARLRPFGENRMKPTAATLSSLALARALKMNPELPHKDGFIAVNLNRNNSEICLLQDGVAIYATKSKINAGMFYRTMEKQLGATGREAETLTKEYFSESEPREQYAGIAPLFNQYIRLLASEIQQAAHFSSVATKGGRIAQAVFVGEGAAWPKLIREVEALIKVKASAAEPPRGMRRKMRGDPDLYPRVAASYGLALQALAPPGREINLAMPKTHAAKVERQNLTQKRIALAATLLGLLAANFAYDLTLDKKRVKAFDDNIDSYQVEVRKAAKVKSEYDGLTEEIEEIRGLLNGRKDWLAVLQEMSDLLPKEVAITEISLSGSTIESLSGTTTSLDLRLPQLLNSSPLFKNMKLVSDLEAVEINGEPAYKFTLKGEIDWSRSDEKAE